MKLAVAALCAALMCGCGSAQNNTPPTTAQAVAHDTVQTVSDAWKVAGELCLASTTPGGCARILDSALGYIETAAGAVDTWQSTSAGRYGCALKQAGETIQRGLAAAGVPNENFPKLLLDALALSGSFGSCPASSLDGGAQ